MICEASLMRPFFPFPREASESKACWCESRCLNCWTWVIRSRELSHPEVQNVGIALDHSIACSHWYDIHIDIKSSANFGLYILICYMTWASASLMLLHSIPDKRWMEVKHCWVWMVKDDELKQRVRTVPSEWWKSSLVQRERPVKMWQ